MLNLQHVNSFLAIVDNRGVRPAARTLGLSPSTIIEHLRQLETCFAALLVHRGRGVPELTHQGRALLPLARALIDTANRAKAVVQGAPLRLAAATNVGAYMLNEPVASFQSGQAERIEIWIGGNPAVADRLASGLADIAMMEWWDQRPGFDATLWRRESLVLIVHPGHRLAGQRSVALHELAQERFLGGERGTGTGAQLRRQLGAAIDRLTIVDGYGSTEAVKRAVRAGLGVSIVLAASIADEVASGQLQALPIEDARLEKDISLITPKQLPPDSAAARFARHVLA